MPEVPGPASDLGRRLVLRREQLGLTRQEVAERAGIAPSYLEYVEQRPSAMPGPVFLVRVADVLETTVSQLRGGESGLPPGMGEAAASPVLDELTADESRALLSDHGIGRVAVTTPDGPAILPVNYDVVDGAVVFRTAPGAAPSLAAGTEVAFEVDRIDEALSEGWSVLVVGPAAFVTSADTVHLLEERAHSDPWAGGLRNVWLRIDPATVTGRRITAA